MGLSPRRRMAALVALVVWAYGLLGAAALPTAAGTPQVITTMQSAVMHEITLFPVFERMLILLTFR